MSTDDVSEKEVLIEIFRQVRAIRRFLVWTLNIAIFLVIYGGVLTVIAAR